MDIEVKILEIKINRNYQTIRHYLDRAEFSHIRKCGHIVKNITEKDIERIKQLIASRKHGGRKQQW